MLLTIGGISLAVLSYGLPMILTAGHVVRRVPLAYEPGLWGIAFPVAMYGVASHELGTALKVPWLVTLGRDEAWPALALWAVVFLAMAAELPRRSARSAPAD